jgi:dihydrodipicolinate synthase/N-acetylneuraminate lyase
MATAVDACAAEPTATVIEFHNAALNRYLITASPTEVADLDAGATGTMPSALLPDLIKPVVELHRAGRRKEAAAAYARILPLINYENRQCGLRACKTVMKQGGVIKSDAVRHPLEPLHPDTRAGLLELAREVNPLALRWGR